MSKIILSEKTAIISIIVLKDDLEKMEKLEKKTGHPPVAHTNNTTKECKQVSKELIDKFSNGNYEIDSFALGYLDTTLFNYMPKNIIEYQNLINASREISDLWPKTIYDIDNQEQLEKAFQWAKEEKKSIGIHIKMPKLLKEEIIVNPFENLDEKLKYYQEAYNENLKLKTFNEIKITGYELI